MRKMTALLLTVAMTLTLAACGSANESSDNNTESSYKAKRRK